MIPQVSPAAIALLEHFEDCSVHPDWAGGDSGIDIGYGCDIGQDPAALNAWTKYLPPADYARLASVRGIKGDAAKAVLHKVRDIVIPQPAALAVLRDFDMPRYARVTLATFPRSDQLPGDSFGALVSLVYNRGSSLEGDRRTEMKWIREFLQDESSWDMIPIEFADMTRLWPGPPTDSNLNGRRYYEGHLFERGLRSSGLVPDDTLLLGDRNDGVKEMQTALKISADGDFGPGTLNAVINWQKKQGIPTHGIGERITLSSLGIHP